MRMLGVISWLGLMIGQAQAADPVPAWITEHSVAGVHIKVSELTQSRSGQQLQQLLAKQQESGAIDLVQLLGMTLKEIESLSIVLVQLESKIENGLVFHVVTAAPYEREKLLKNLQVRHERDHALANQTRKTFGINGDRLLCLGGARSYTIVSGEESGLGLLETLLGVDHPRASEDLLADQLGKHALTAWINGRRLPKEVWDEVPAELQPLRELTQLVLTADISTDAAELMMHMQFPRNGLAADGLRALEEGRQLAATRLKQFEKDLSKAPGDAATAALLGAIQRALAAARLRHKDTAVNAVARIEVAQSLQIAVAEGVGYLQTRAHRIQSINHIKQLSLAFHNYESAYNRLPPAAICDRNGKPLLSWRVAVLPFIEQEELYRQFKTDEPWDSAHNKKLIAQMPALYRLPGDRKKHAAPSTYYQVFVGANAIFQWQRGGRLVEITDGTSQTIWLTEAATAVPWTKPDDIAYDPAKAPGIGYHFGDRANIGFADGSVRSIRKSLKPEILHLLIQKNDGMVLPPLDD